jgi:Na+/melibiose symporter-like transporter
MGKSTTPSTRPRFVLAGLAYACSFYLFLGLVIIFEPRMRTSHWRGWEFVSWVLGAMAIALVVVGICLLTWIFLPYAPARSKRSFSDKTPRQPGVWDRQLDG